MRHGDEIGTQATCPSEPPSFLLGEMCPRWHCPKRVAWKPERFWPQSWPGFTAVGNETEETCCVLGRFLVCLLAWQSGLWLCDGDRQIGMEEGVKPLRVRKIDLSGFLSLRGSLPMLEVQEAAPRPPTASLTALLAGRVTLPVALPLRSSLSSSGKGGGHNTFIHC